MQRNWLLQVVEEEVQEEEIATSEAGAKMQGR